MPCSSRNLTISKHLTSVFFMSVVKLAVKVLDRRVVQVGVFTRVGDKTEDRLSPTQTADQGRGHD